MKDWRGTEIEPGDIVVYPGTASSSCWITEAEVMGIEMRKRGGGRPDYETLRVRTLRSTWGGTPHRANDRPKGVLLQVPGRVTVVQKHE